MIKLFNSKFNNKSILATKKNFLSGQIYIGNQVDKLEINLLKFFKKHKEVVAVSDLSNAMFLLLKVCNIKKDDEILVASFNCLSSTTSIVNIGAKPVWVDLNKDYQSTVYFFIEKYLKDKSSEILSLIVLFIELYYNNQLLNGKTDINQSFSNYAKILQQISDMKKFNLGEKSIFLSIKNILENEKK